MTNLGVIVIPDRNMSMEDKKRNALYWVHSARPFYFANPNYTAAEKFGANDDEVREIYDYLEDIAG